MKGIVHKDVQMHSKDQIITRCHSTLMLLNLLSGKPQQVVY